MTRTRRIYNNPRLKKTKRKVLVYDGANKTFKTMTNEEMRAYVTDSLRNAVAETGFIYHPYASGLCMGHCHFCRDPTKDQKRLRKLRKADFRHELVKELTSESPVEFDEDGIDREIN